jgi:hypothetical protein
MSSGEGEGRRARGLSADGQWLELADGPCAGQAVSAAGLGRGWLGWAPCIGVCQAGEAPGRRMFWRYRWDGAGYVFAGGGWIVETG